MNKYEIEEIISGDSARDEKQENEALIDCVSCNEKIDTDNEECSYIHEDLYCLQCLDDGDLLAYRYG